MITPVFTTSTTMQANAAQSETSQLARSAAEEHPKVKQLHQEVVELTGKKDALENVLTLPREDRLALMKKDNPALYDEIGKSVHNKINSTAFRICAGTWIAGSVLAMGACVAAVMGSPLSSIGYAFPAMLGLGTGVSRLYLSVAEKKKGPEMKDQLAVKCLEYQKGELEQTIVKKKAAEEELLQKISSENQGLVNAASGEGVDNNAVKTEDEYVDIDGVKLKVNKSMDLVTGPSLKASHSWFSH
ncbi:MAG: hypothetical protein AB9903_11015 [Vulcanimicrobiota bacterium]